MRFVFTTRLTAKVLQHSPHCLHCGCDFILHLHGLRAGQITLSTVELVYNLGIPIFPKFSVAICRNMTRMAQRNEFSISDGFAFFTARFLIVMHVVGSESLSILFLCHFTFYTFVLEERANPVLELFGKQLAVRFE